MEILEIIHSDICGPFQTHIHIGCTYFITFIDDKSRYTIVYSLKHLKKFNILRNKLKLKLIRKSKSPNRTMEVNISLTIFIFFVKIMG
jgi:hypothetical protein